MSKINKPVILVLDDDKVFVDVLNKALTRRGYTVLPATHGEQALAQATNIPPAYAIVDLKIDRESGLDLLTPLLAINPRMKILILTGYSSIATAVHAIKRGAMDYACKPLDADEILQKLLGTSISADEPGLPENPLSVNRLEWEHIQRVLDDNNGNISATARSLGMHRRTLQRKLQKKPTRQ